LARLNAAPQIVSGATGKWSLSVIASFIMRRYGGKKIMNKTADIINILKTLRVNPVSEEYDLQREIAGELKKANIEFTPEYNLGRRSRVDFMIADSGIIIEVKKGKPYTKKVIEQLYRYAAFAEVKVMILVVETSLMHLPRNVNGKPVYCIGLNKLWGIAL
jgi:hypothetical protein